MPNHSYQTCLLCLRSTLDEIKDGRVVFDRLLHVLQGEYNGKELMDAMEDFLKSGNILEISHGKLSKLRASPKEICRMADELLKMYLCMKKEWKLMVYVILMTITWVSIALYFGKDYFSSTGVLIGVLCVVELYRKGNEYTIEKKIQGVAKVRKMALSCFLIQNHQKAFSDKYEQLMANVNIAKKKDTIEELRERVGDVAKEARLMKPKIEKMEKDMEKAETLAGEAISDTSFMDINEELAAVLPKS